jgi:hypothetical protein
LALPSTRTVCSDPAISARPPGASRLIERKLLVDLRRGDPLRLQRRGVEDDADLAVDAALAADLGDAVLRRAGGARRGRRRTS